MRTGGNSCKSPLRQLLPQRPFHLPVVFLQRHAAHGVSHAKARLDLLPFPQRVKRQDSTFISALEEHSRAGSHPQSFVAGWQGYLVADAYAGYDRLFANPALKEVGCWAHAPRKFFEVAKTQKKPGLAHEAVRRIGQFYHLDNAWQYLEPDERRRRRQAEIAPLLAAFRDWLAAHLPGLLPKSPLAQAMGYAANHWQALTRFLDDGRLPLDNNAAERALRPIAVGRKNWLFAGSERGGEAAAIVLSFIESAKLHGLNPYAYLRDLLTRLPSAKPADLDSLLPDAWQPQ